MAQTLKFGNGTWATKKDSILAYNDQNENYKPLPFNYTGAGKGTRVNKEGLIEVVENDRPRIDYKDSEDGVFLLEKAATNLITYSEDFSNSVWSTWQSTKTLSNNINPEGTNGYYEISHTGSSSDNPNTRLTNVSLNGSYTLSSFIKINQSRYISLSIEDYNGDRARVYFDTINKTFTTISNVGSPITNTSYSEFSNGWIRISLSVNLLNAVYDEVGIGIYNPSGSFPSASGEVISVFGAMIEQGSYASSYIPTQGTIQTRVQETASGSGNSEVFNDSEGVLFADISALNNDLTNRAITISDKTSNNRIFITYYAESNGLFSQIVSNGVAQATLITKLTSITNSTKVLVKYKQNDFSLWVNGFEVSYDESGVTPIGLDDFSFDRGTGTLNFYGKTKEIAYYDTVLTDLELETLTSYRTWESMVNELNLNVIYNG
jgi:hypothetical protein